MRRVLMGVVFTLLGCRPAEMPGDWGADARLVEAQAAFEKAVQLTKAGKYPDALALGDRALALREAARGSTHPEVADCLQLLGNIHHGRGDFDSAKTFLKRGLDLREAALNKNYPDIAHSLNDLGGVYGHLGEYGEAKQLYERALAIREEVLGDYHLDVAKTLHNLGSLYSDQGEYGQAEPLLQRALAIKEAVLETNDPNIPSSLVNLAILYRAQGSDERAEPLLQRALTIWESALGQNHPALAIPLNNLANVYEARGLNTQAEPLLQRALAISESGVDKNHPAIAASLQNLAVLYRAQGLNSRAEPLYLRALAIRERAYGKEHRDIATSLNNLAHLYADQGSYRRAKRLYQRALAMREVLLGKEHPDVVRSLIGLARIYLAEQRLAEALPLLTRALALSEGRLRKEALVFSEPRLVDLLRLLRTDEERLYSLLKAHPEDEGMRRLALAAALLLKGRSVEESASISRSIYSKLDPEDRHTFERLRALRTQLAKLSFDGPGSSPATDHEQRLKRLADEGDALEAELARRSAPLREMTALPPLAEIIDRVTAALPQDAALVEFVAYTDHPLLPKPGTPESKIPSQPRYLALVLSPDGQTGAIDLGRAGPINAAVSRLHTAFISRDVAVQGPAQALYQLAFRPLLQLLRGARKIVLAPDGQLGLIPFAALHDGRHYLLDSHEFIYVTSGKELLPRAEAVPPARGVVVLADPDFGTSPAAQASSLTEWVPLPGTREEAQAVQSLLPQARLFLGPDATKERLLRLPTPRVLHLATHGFFVGDDTASADSRSPVAIQSLGDDAGLGERLRDSMLRSGLVLADAGDSVARRRGTALVTASEISGLALWGTELVVLSACNSGRGDVKPGQGIYGLRRAFVIAGAETLVMSLWKVNDKTTRELMEGYYRNLLAGEGRVGALRDAMLELRERYPHPSYWAPFIGYGKDAPLSGLP